MRTGQHTTQLCAFVLLTCLLGLRGSTLTSRSNTLPDGFVYVSAAVPSVVQEIRYAGLHNFVGRVIPGYDAAECILTAQAAKALALAQSYFLSLPHTPFTLKVYDCYRPVQSVDAFIQWSLNFSDTLNKAEFYPTLPKNELFADGFIAVNSSHSRGSTVDITIVPYPPPRQPIYTPGQPLYSCNDTRPPRWADNSLDMGTGFDCFMEQAHTNTTHITVEQYQNRQIFENGMKNFGFINLAEEWWHFTLSNEPFPHTYFNFTISKPTNIVKYMMM